MGVGASGRQDTGRCRWSENVERRSSKSRRSGRSFHPLAPRHERGAGAMKKQRPAVARRAPQRQQEKQWDAKFYETKHAVVWQAAADLIDLLAPAVDERILDLGCGT